ncbi:MAG TPA: CCA tRNA nucleotidyltransferase [Bryobacteraceae bacterium]|nr:CCA tRNA nucleotidyltransferase [Bryobacteraceae bacterium]
MTSEELARSIVARLRASGHQAYLVGGCVRDLLLGRTPKDFDVATEARPDRITELFERSEQVGAHFGVVLVRENTAQVEVATFRSDASYSDGRRPDAVCFEASPRQDVMRRDFTINALLLDPDTNEVLDFAGGRADLSRRLIRAIGDADARFREDHLRLIRAVRFAARLGFEIEPQTLAALQRLHRLILRVAPERIRDELVRILTEGGARRGFELLDATGLLGDLLPEVAAMKGVAQPPEFHPEGDVWTHTLLLLERLRSPTPTLAMGALLHDVGKPPAFRVADRIRFDGHVEEGVRLARGILGRLRFSNEQAEMIEALIANHMRFKDTGKMRESTLKRFLRMENFAEHLELHRLDCLASNGRLETYKRVCARLAEMGEEELRPKLLLSGRDLIEAGYQPGPQFATMLAALEDAQLEGRVKNRDEALALVRAQFGPATE